MTAASRPSELFAQLADQNVHGFEFGLVDASIELVEGALPRHRGALAHAEQFEDSVFPVGQVDRLIVDRGGSAIQAIVRRSNGHSQSMIRTGRLVVNLAFELVVELPIRGLSLAA